MTNITPVILITGFLGAGKTSFINYVLKHSSDKKISLILNEFGDIKLESQFIQKKGVGLISELAGGCLCCVARVDLPRVIRYTLEQAPQTEYLIIEASGLSDPDPVRATLTGSDLADLIRLDIVIAIVDALNFVQTSRDHPLVMSQIAEGDLAIISKSNQLDKNSLDSLINRVSHIGTGTRTLVWDNNFDPGIIFDPSLGIKKSPDAHHHQHDSYEQYWYEDKNFHKVENLQNALSSLPDNILRVKGYTDNGKLRYLVQKVGNHVDVRIGNSKGQRETAILIIGNALDKPSLTTIFQGSIE